MEDGKRVVVGVNAFRSEGEDSPALLRVDAQVGARQCRRLDDLRRNRDAAKAQAALDGLAKAAEGSENTMPFFVECAESGVTLGEMCDVLRGIWGEQKESLVF
jgi:methylmalonyl-CoA mutase N-terminal domain/subunit